MVVYVSTYESYNGDCLDYSFDDVKKFECNDKFCLIDGKKYIFSLEWPGTKKEIDITFYKEKWKNQLYNFTMGKDKYVLYNNRKISKSH